MNASNSVSRLATRASSSSIESLHPVFGFPDGRGHPEPTQAENASGRGGECLRAPVAAAVEAREPASPRTPPLTRRAGWRRLKAGYDRVSDSLLGDAIGLVCIALIVFLFLIVTP
ncbi:hypothetical protein [Paracoccus onubensis]|uniref:hypothetical protein n=1 Tax=Paracoccus onubensis TaxID=1675788 RepID=UPI001602F46D|nr:hypothetical protein [Paracoccus onubensis]